MNKREWATGHSAQSGWRAPSTQPAHPFGHDYRLPPNPASFGWPPQPGPAITSGANTRFAGESRAFGPQNASSAPANATNPAPLWWLRRGAHAHGGPQHDPAPVAAGFRSLEAQLRELTTKIETLRHQAPRPGAAQKQTQQSLDNIVAPLMQAVPLRAIEALNADIQGLAERIDVSRKSGSDPRLLAPIEYGLNDIRVVVRQLKPAESLAAFRAALRDLSERLDQGPDANAHHISPQAQVETVIASLHNIGGLVAAKDTITTLSEEVRGLSAKLQRVTASRRNAPEDKRPALPGGETAPEAAPLSSSIEHKLRDINLRLDALQKVPAPVGNQQKTDPFDRDTSTHDALQAAHSTLSQLVEQLAGALRSIGDTNDAHRRYEHSPSRDAHIQTGTPPRDGAIARNSGLPQTRFRDDAPQPFETGDLEAERPARSIVIPVRPLIFGAVVIVLATVAARVSMQMTDIPLPALARAEAIPAAIPQESSDQTELAEVEVPDLVRSQAPDPGASEPELPPQIQRSALAVADQENSGVIGRPVPVAAGARDSAREPSLPLPESLPAALRIEAKKGKPAAEYEVGVRLVEGKSVPVNTEEGLRWLRRAAKSGIVPAHLWIGSLYEKGLGVEKDLNLARTHYLAAAEKGNAKAMHNLAVLYAEGIDGRRDYKTAVRWFQRAAERGIADSQYNLAVLRMRGIGTDQNHRDAYKWFALAALQGDREAARHRDEIGGKLEPGILAAARSAVQKFSPQPQPTEAVVVAAPPGGWDRASGDAGSGRKSQSGIFARGAS